MQKTVFRVIDRRDKMSPKEWEEYALNAGLTSEQLQGILRMQMIPDLWQKSDDLQRVFAILEKMGMRDYVELTRKSFAAWITYRNRF
jgi:hypothetical protein